MYIRSQTPSTVEFLLNVVTVCRDKVLSLMTCGAEGVLRLESCDFLLVTSYLTVVLFATEIPFQYKVKCKISSRKSTKKLKL